MQRPTLALLSAAACAVSLLAAGCGDRGSANSAATSGVAGTSAARAGAPAAPPPSAEAQRQMEAIKNDAGMPEQAKAMSMNRVMSQEQRR